MIKKLSVISFLLGVVLLTASCSPLGQPEANNMFLKKHPGYEIIDSGPGEGDSDAVYYHFRFKKPGDEKVHEEVWQFLWEENEWKMKGQTDKNQ